MARQMIAHGHVLVNGRRNKSVLADAAASTLERGATGSKDINPEPPRELVFRSAT
jgi:S4 domain